VQLDGFDQRRRLPESMAHILANPVNICFGLMPVTSTTPAACFVIESNVVTADQQIEADLLTETHPPTPSDLIARIDRVEGMLSDTIKVCEHVKHPHVTSSLSSMFLGPKTQDRGSCRSHLDEPCPINEKSKHMALVLCPPEASSTSYCGPLPPAEPRAVSEPPCIPGPHYDLPELSGRRERNLRSPDLGCFSGHTTSRWGNR
jgi:hypothetical protein